VTDGVLVERRDGVLVVTIDRPEARNALDRAVAEGVAAAVDELDADEELRVGVLTGAGGTFSAGMDLKAFLRGETPAIEGRGLCGITQTPPRKPLVAAVEGWALAGGFELVLACDLVVAAETARFGVPEVKRSLVAAGGGAPLLPARVPRNVAMEMLLTGDPIDAPTALSWGLVNRVVPADALGSEADALARRVASASGETLAIGKPAVAENLDLPLEEAYRHASGIMARNASAVDAREGMDAFLGKRDPVWTHGRPPA
jgi:enoyl-CoA hydratase